LGTLATGYGILMILLPITPLDIPRVDELYKDWGWPEDVTKLASDTGIMCMDDEILGAVFFYKTNSPMAWVDLMVVKKDLKKKKKDEVFDLLVKGLDRMTVDYGYKYLAASPIYKKTCERITKHGFRHIESGTYWKEY
jgi:hypothetical protein